MHKMTKSAIEKAIRDFLNEHLELIPQLEREGIIDLDIKQICMSEQFVYKGRGEYEFAGHGEGWIITNDDGKSSRQFKILPSFAFISEEKDCPVVEKTQIPVIIELI